MPEELIGSAEAAEILHLDRSTLVRQVRAGLIPSAVKLPGRTGSYLFDRAEVEKRAAESGEKQ